MDHIGSMAGSPAGRQNHMIMVASELTERRIRNALRDVIDADRGINIIDLGLVYRIEIVGRTVSITMTMTAPDCPAQKHILSGVRERLLMIPAVDSAHINLVWTPRWSPQRMTPAANALCGVEKHAS